MLLENVSKLEANTLLSDELFEELFNIEDCIDRQRTVFDLEDRAKALGIKAKFDKMLKAYENYIKEQTKAEIVVPEPMEPKVNVTEFSIAKQQYICGDWIANDNGIYIHTREGMAQACPHPIFLTKILCNSETGQYKVELKFKVRGKTRTALVDRDIIASPNKILKLANDSVMVTSLNAPYLVKYLSDIESLNEDIITEHASTSRLGWITGTDIDGNEVKKFLPYDEEVIFDNELEMKSLFNSIQRVGSRKKWFDMILEIRSKKQPEVLINLAASFASVLVEPCGALPFIVSLWGGTGIGKTVILMMATSVWADPNEGAYMTDAKATTTAMEIRMNILNSLPMTLDDMAQVKNQYDDDFSELIYRWCAGKGRDRSNVNLGLNKLTSWRNCTITNGERSLVDETTQGGAVNRVIDIESDGAVLFDGTYGNEVANVFRKNFGYAGPEFVDLVESMGFSEVGKIMDSYIDQLKKSAEASGTEKEDKQLMPMALILTADELIEKYLFKDGVRLNVDKCCNYLKNKGEVSEHKRAYEYIKGYVVSNGFHFKDNADEPSSDNVQVWGYWKTTDTIVIIGTIFDKILSEGGFQPRAFLSWAKKQKLIELDPKGYPKKQIKLNGNNIRCVVLKMEDEEESLDFTEVEASDDIPFA